VALKAFPVVMALLFLSDRRYKEILITAAVAIGITLASYFRSPAG